MKPPAAPDTGAPADSICLQVMKKRADFVACSKARRHATPGIHLQARKRREGEADGIRVGFTCSKKVGNAVMRNRAKRRLKEAARMILSTHGKEGWDYVLIGRRGVTIDRPWDDLLSDLQEALAKVH